MKNLYLILIFSLVFSGTTGKIKGRIIDHKTGNPVAGCNVFLENTMYGTSSDLDGFYVIFNVSPGIYSLNVQMIGYAKKVYSNIHVNIDFTTTINIELETELLEGEVIIVQSETPLINKGLTASTAIVNKDMIEKLPVTELSEVLNLQAGFVSGHLRGGRSGEVAYWIDGVPIFDGYDGGTIVDVSKDMVEEMQLVSGAFNAEYGQAMSGIVNIVTKDGSNDFGGHLNLYSGDYLSNKSDIFWNINQFNPITTQNIDLNLHGNLIEDKLFYYLNTRYIYFQGVHEGREIFSPNSVGMEYIDSAGVSSWYILGTNAYIDSVINYSILESRLEDVDNTSYVDSMYTILRNVHDYSQISGNWVPMNWNIKKYVQGKLIYRFSPYTKMKYSLISDNVTYQDYDRMYRLNPHGNLMRHRLGFTQILNIDHSFGRGQFLNFGLTKYNKRYSHKAFENDEEYVHSTIGTPPDSYSFLSGGSNNNVFSRQTETITLKLDVTSQLNPIHQLKTGLEFRKHKLKYNNENLQPPDFLTTIDPIYQSPFLLEPQIMADSTIHTSRYKFEPVEMSVYIQDKIELNEIIVNAGIRFDYFDPKGKVLNDPADPSIYNPIKPENRFEDLNGDGVQNSDELSVTLNDRENYWFKNTISKAAVSPRLGASFPFSDRGVIHFSYGHFFQIPRFELLYYNSDFDLGQGTGNVGIIGNADLKPEKTISYELGIQQIISQKMSFEATIYMRDIRDLTGTRSEEIIMFGGASSYSKYENSDFAFVRGFVFSLNTRPENGFSGSLDYTFQLVKGTASDPNQARNAIAGGAMPEVHLIPLNWDQRHTLNSTLNYFFNNGGISFIGQFGSGLPYTPESTEDISTLVQNSSRKPMTSSVDMKIFYNVRFNSYKINFYCRIMNLFDQLNQYGVYADTGVADRTKYLSIATSQNTSEFYNSVHDWFKNETFYSNPRRIEIGMSIAF